MLASGRRSWRVAERVRVYRARTGGGRIVDESDDAEVAARNDARDYDGEWYVRQLRDTFAARMVRAFTTADYAAVFPHPDQLSLFAPPIDGVRAILVGEAVSILPT